MWLEPSCADSGKPNCSGERSVHTGAASSHLQGLQGECANQPQGCAFVS